MDEIYLRLLELLEGVSGINWLDMDKAQLEQDRPPVDFPCLLINIEFPNTDDQGGNVQLCNVRATLRLAFNYTGETAKATPVERRLQSLEYFRIVKAIYLAVQGKTGIGGKFKRRAQVLEPRPDGLTVLQMPFDTTFLDKSAG